MSRARLIEGIFIGLIFVIAFAANLYLSMNTPLWSDNARDANTITQIAESGELSPTLRYWMGTPKSNLPIFYPQLYYVLVATLSQFIGDAALHVVPAASVAFWILAIYILARFLGGYKVGILALIASLGLMISNNRMEADTSVWVLLVLSMMAFYKAMETRHRGWLLVSSILVAGAVGMKQVGWFALLFIVIGTITYACLHQRGLSRAGLLKGLLIIVIAVSLCSATLWYQFSTTGYVSYIGNLPGFVGEVEEKVATVLGIERYERNSDYVKYGEATEVAASRKAYTSPQGTREFMNPFTQPRHKEVLPGFFVLFSALGIACMLRDKNIKALILTFTVLVLLAINCVLVPLRSYFEVLPVLWGIVLAYGLVMVTKTILQFANFRVATVIVAITILLFTTGSSLAATKLYDFRLRSVIGTQSMQEEYQEAGQWISENLPESAIILNSRTSELAQYAHRRMIWIGLIGGTELYEALNFGTEEELVSTMRQQNVSYIFIDKRWVAAPNKWVAYIAPQAASMVESSAHFKQIFHTEKLMLYELIAK